MGRWSYVPKGGGKGPHKCPQCKRRYQKPLRHAVCTYCRYHTEQKGHRYVGGREHVSPMPAEFAAYHEARIAAEEARVELDMKRLGIA